MNILFKHVSFRSEQGRQSNNLYADDPRRVVRNASKRTLRRDPFGGFRRFFCNGAFEQDQRLPAIVGGVRVLWPRAE